MEQGGGGPSCVVAIPEVFKSSVCVRVITSSPPLLCATLRFTITLQLSAICDSGTTPPVVIVTHGDSFNLSVLDETVTLTRSQLFCYHNKTETYIDTKWFVVGTFCFVVHSRAEREFLWRVTLRVCSQ